MPERKIPRKEQLVVGGLLAKDIDLNQLQKIRKDLQQSQVPKEKKKPPITNPAECNEGKKCITNAGKKDPSQGAGGRWWTACQNYPVCMHPYYSGCYYTWGPHTYCMYG